MIYGWLCALFIAAVGHPLGNVGARLAVTSFNAAPIAYTCMVMICASFALLVIAKPGPLGLETLRRPETWVYGLLQTLIYALGVYVVLYVSGTEASVTMRVSTLIMFVMSFIFVGQKTNRYELLGFVMMAAGIIYMITLTNLSANEKAILVMLLTVRGLAQASHKIIAEFHKTNRKAEGFRHNTRVTAFIVSVSSLILTGIFMVIGYFKESLALTTLIGMPLFSDFFNLKTLALASFIGLFVLSFSKYCEFYAAKKISAKYLLSVIALQPIFAIFYESSLASLGMIELRPFSTEDYIAMTAVMSGSILIALSGLKMHKNKTPQENWNKRLRAEVISNPLKIQQVQEIVEATLVFTENNKEKAAQILGINNATFDALLTLNTGDIQITEDLAQTIQDQFTANISGADALTGLPNRLKFLSKAKTILSLNAPTTFFFIDLNKFKPINDTYGHDAGDAALKTIATRLNTLCGKKGVVARLGGDEFAILLPNSTPELAETLRKNVLAEIERPVTLPAPKGTTATLGASIGLATFPEDGTTADALLTLADERMYSKKKGR
jgi:diguanylate cyclase (GGDEF)-like protein